MKILMELKMLRLIMKTLMYQNLLYTVKSAHEKFKA